MHIYNYIVILFSVSEGALFIFKRSKTNAQKSNTDKRSLLFLWLTIPLALTLSGFIAGYQIGPSADIKVLTDTGILISVMGFIIRWAAILQLGKFFTVDVAIADEHTLKTEGLYKIVRHPSYLGLMLIVMGLGLCMENAISFAIVVIPIFIALNYRIMVEEKALTNEFGIQYHDYCKKVPKLIPWIY